MLLCSGLKSDSVDALREILISTVKSLVGPGLISIGDSLDDIIHEKFGKDSYVRIGGGMSPTRKRTASNMFNDKENRKFVCLMETRACIPSIKLSSIDTVILLNSDWDPMNDLRALHKINLSLGREQLKIFRIYLSCNLEEKILILAKQGTTHEDMIDNEPHVFWINLLNGRNPRWKYLSSPSSRAIKKGKRHNDLREEPEEEEKSNKKCRKEARSTANQRCPTDLKPRMKKKLHAQYKKRKFSVLQHPCNEPLQPSSSMPLAMTGDRSELIVTNLGTTNASLISGNKDPPEANRLTHSEAKQSVCLSLQRELERLQKDKDENLKLHDDMALNQASASARIVSRPDELSLSIAGFHSNINRNLVAGYELRAPAPHHRSMRPISISGPNLLSSPSTGIHFPPPISQSVQMQHVFTSVPAIPHGEQFLFRDVSYASSPYFWDLDRT
ncbi:unnamed protein product [Fraxinus pennsylvanica]|uniref:Helicase C-terminal domain-containing protein n=1 Tax=Fraxinus pennsylvanica TaxID=56036 RepID=A0AAD2E8X1_9LAMI|nr:unnamed protein product [Fraxinus pennsylvanica]